MLEQITIRDAIALGGSSDLRFPERSYHPFHREMCDEVGAIDLNENIFLRNETPKQRKKAIAYFQGHFPLSKDREIVAGLLQLLHRVNLWLRQ